MRAEGRFAFWLLLTGFALSACGWNPFGGRTFTARVTDAAGQPLPGAVASSEGHAAIADAQGRVTLSGVGTRVRVQKTGYSPSEVEYRTGAVSLTRRTEPLRVIWDERFTNGLRMEGLKAHLASKGLDVQTLTSGALPAGFDTAVLACPAWFTETAYSEYMRAAQAGTKLVLLGEWGGYDGVDLVALTSLAAKAGITFDSGQVRLYGEGGQPQSWLSIKGIAPAPLAAGIQNGVTVFTSGVLSVASPATPVLTSMPEAVRILRWDVGAQTVAATGPLGRSLVLAIADSSLFSDEAGPDGSPQWKAADNARFAENVMGW